MGLHNHDLISMKFENEDWCIDLTSCRSCGEKDWVYSKKHPLVGALNA